MSFQCRYGMFVSNSHHVGMKCEINQVSKMKAYNGIEQRRKLSLNAYN